MKRSKVMEEPAGCSTEDIALRARPEHLVEAQVLPGDTLQAIALRFHCQISELKRINHIHKDNEIFARRTIKVPVTPYSILTEALPPPPPEPAPSKPEDHVIDYNAAILNSHIAPTAPYTDEANEVTTENSLLIPSAPKRESLDAVVVKDLTSHSADFGIKWLHLLACVLLLGVVIPLVYVLFYLDKHHDVHAVPVSHPPH